MQLIFDRGTLVIRGSPTASGSLPGILWDPRVQVWRAPAYHYRELAAELLRRHPDLHDEVCPRLALPPPITFPELRPYQAAAVAAWVLLKPKTPTATEQGEIQVDLH